MGDEAGGSKNHKASPTKWLICLPKEYCLFSTMRTLLFSQSSVVAHPSSFTPSSSEMLSQSFLQQELCNESQPLTPPQVSISAVLKMVQPVQ